MRGEELKPRIRRILSSLIKLAVAVVVLASLDALFGGIQFEAFGLKADTTEVLGAVRLLVIIYYGYWILRDSFYFLDLLSEILARKFGLEESGNLRRIGLDFLYLISLTLAWFGLSPFLGLLPELVIRAISITFIVISIIFLYDLVKTVYSILRVSFDSLVDMITDLIGRELSSGNQEGKSKK